MRKKSVFETRLFSELHSARDGTKHYFMNIFSCSFLCKNLSFSRRWT